MTDTEEWDGIPDFLRGPDKVYQPDREPSLRMIVAELQAMDPSENPKFWRPDGNGYIFEVVLGRKKIKLVAVRGGKFRVRMPVSEWQHRNFLSG